MIKKIWTIILAVLILMSMVACDADDGGEEINPDKTQLYVNVYNCGIGLEFARTLKAEYEKQHSNVQIILSSTDLDSESLAVFGSDESIDIAFAPNVVINNFVNVRNGDSDHFADITDVLIEGGANSISAKMYSDEKAYHNVGTEQSPKYFSLPWYVSYFGTVYDVDLFEDKGYFNLSDYKGLDCIDNTADDCWGPDGIEHTYDDGLPATWEDMKALLSTMSGDGVTPFTWTSYKGYTPSWLEALWASYEGVDNYSLLRSFEGKYVSSVNNKEGFTPITGNKYELSVSKSNGYEMATQNGKTAALTVAKYITNNKLYSEKALDSSQKHTAAQEEYLMSVEMQSYSSNVHQIAFLMEGNWWENEAKEIFNDMAADDDSYAFGQRRFAYFPFPKFIGSSDIPDQVNTKTVLNGSIVSNQTNACVVNKKSKQLALAKDFIKFAYSDFGNAAFTTDTGVLRPFDYTLSDAQLNKLTYYQRSVYTLVRETSTEKTSGLSRSGIIFENSRYIENICAFLGKNASNQDFGSNPLTEFALNRDMTVAEYLQGVKKYVDSSLGVWG